MERRTAVHDESRRTKGTRRVIPSDGNDVFGIDDAEREATTGVVAQKLASRQFNDTDTIALQLIFRKKILVIIRRPETTELRIAASKQYSIVTR